MNERGETPRSPSLSRDEVLHRLQEASVSFVELCAIYLGDRLGLYRALHELGPATPAQVARAAGVHERYAREWLEQQAVSGLLAVDGDADPGQRRYTLPAGAAEVLLDRDSLAYFAPSVRLTVGLAPALPALLAAYRTGAGLPWSAYGADLREGQAESNRAAFLTLLGREWLPAIPDLHARLQADPPARVADIGCGAGWSSIGLALAYPRVRVDGLDSDATSIALARANAAAAGVADRVTMSAENAGESARRGRYDLVTVFEALHDMPRPVEVLRAAREMLAPGASVLVVDERVAEVFTAPGDAFERVMYGLSLLCCLPVGLADQPSVATGTLMRPATLRGYAHEAGYRGVEILPIAHDSFRFYRLHP